MGVGTGGVVDMCTGEVVRVRARATQAWYARASGVGSTLAAEAQAICISATCAASRSPARAIASARSRGGAHREHHLVHARDAGRINDVVQTHVRQLAKCKVVVPSLEFNKITCSTRGHTPQDHKPPPKVEEGFLCAHPALTHTPIHTRSHTHNNDSPSCLGKYTGR